MILSKKNKKTILLIITIFTVLILTTVVLIACSEKNKDTETENPDENVKISFEYYRTDSDFNGAYYLLKFTDNNFVLYNASKINVLNTIVSGSYVLNAPGLTISSNDGTHYVGEYSENVIKIIFGDTPLTFKQAVIIEYDTTGSTTTLRDGYAIVGQTMQEPSRLVSQDDRHRFEEFTVDVERTKIWNFETDIVKESMKLYAKFVDLYYVTFDANGGSNTSLGVYLANGDMYPQAGAATWAFGTFLGYYTQKDGGEQVYQSDMTSIVMFTEGKDITLYAQWDSNVDGDFLFTGITFTDDEGNEVYGYTVKAFTNYSGGYINEVTPKITGEIIIPSEFKGRPVLQIDLNGFRSATDPSNPAPYADLSEVTKIYIPNTVIDIRATAFQNLYGLTDVYIPSSVTTFARMSDLFNNAGRDNDNDAMVNVHLEGAQSELPNSSDWDSISNVTIVETDYNYPTATINKLYNKIFYAKL